MLTVLILLVCVSAAYAHGTGYTLLSSEGVTVLRFSYSSGEPMQFAEIKVFAPSSVDAEVIFGYADRHGVYSFVPDEDGDWRVEAADGMGHKAAAAVSVRMGGNDLLTEGKNVSGLPVPLRVVFGLSLIVNIFVLYRLIIKRWSKV